MVVVKLLETTAELAMRKVTRSAGIGSANSSSLECGVPMYTDNVVSDALTACRDGLTVVAVVMSTGGWIEDDVGKKAAEEDPPYKEGSAAA